MTGARYVFAAEMGAPADVHEETIEAGGEELTVSILSMGNPQCVVLGPLPDDERFVRLGPALERHRRFPERHERRVRADRDDRTACSIRIWERGVGPTESSGTGSCAAAVAAAAHGGAHASGRGDRAWRLADCRVDAPDGVVLTGWAEIICDGIFSADL